MLGAGARGRRQLLQGSRVAAEYVKIVAHSAEDARCAMDTAEGLAASTIGLTNLRPPGDGPGAMAMSPMLLIETDMLGGNFGALEHSQSIAGKLKNFDLSASLRAQGLALNAGSVLGTQTVLPLLPPPPQPPLYLHQIGYGGSTERKDIVGYGAIGIGLGCTAIIAWFLYYNGVFCEPYWVKRKKRLEKERLDRQELLKESEHSSSRKAELPAFSPNKPKDVRNRL